MYKWQKLQSFFKHSSYLTQWAAVSTQHPPIYAPPQSIFLFSSRATCHWIWVCTETNKNDNGPDVPVTVIRKTDSVSNSLVLLGLLPPLAWIGRCSFLARPRSHRPLWSYWEPHSITWTPDTLGWPSFLETKDLVRCVLGIWAVIWLVVRWSGDLRLDLDILVQSMAWSTWTPKLSTDS